MTFYEQVLDVADFLVRLAGGQVMRPHAVRG